MRNEYRRNVRSTTAKTESLIKAYPNFFKFPVTFKLILIQQPAGLTYFYELFHQTKVRWNGILKYYFFIFKLKTTVRRFVNLKTLLKIIFF